MPSTTGLLAWRYPLLADPADAQGTGANIGFQDSLSDAEQFAAMRFASAAARTTAFSAASVTPVEGMQSYLQDVNWWEFYTGATHGWAPMPGTILKRGSRPTSSTATAGEIGVLRIPGFSVVGAQRLKIYTNPLTADSSVNGDLMSMAIRYTIDGSTPTTGSPVLPGAVARYKQDDSNNGETVSIDAGYTPASNLTLSLLLTVARITGSGNVVLFADGTFLTEMTVEAGGTDPGDSGVDV